MGFRLRKSINLGGGFRINISKSGIGYSWGIKGIRYTKTSSGKTRTTYSIPGSGLSYVKEENQRKQTTERQKINQFQDQNNIATSSEISTESVNISDYQPIEYENLLSKIRLAQKLDFISNWLIASFILAVIPIFILTAIAGVVLKIAVRTKMKVPMEYTFDGEPQIAYDRLSSYWMELNKNQKFWQTISARYLEKNQMVVRHLV